MLDNHSLDTLYTRSQVDHALVSIYSRPDEQLLDDSYGTLWACHYTGVNDLRVIETHTIFSVVSMQPLPLLPGERDDLWFLVEKSGLDDIQLSGVDEPLDGDQSLDS
jgi:hypothetical protein